jgi:L-alanine-DL-glutamate epimerase-like enolase superfamily enzyme
MHIQRRGLLEGAVAAAAASCFPAALARGATERASYLFSLHFTAAIPNAGPFVEFSIEEDANRGEALYRPALVVKDGKVEIPDGPGRGVARNPAWLRKASYLKSETRKKR